MNSKYMEVNVLFLILNYKSYQDTILQIHELLSDGIDNNYILVVDNASPNDSYKKLYDEFVGIERVEIIQSPNNGGYANGNNFGLKYAEKYKPKYACIINNDVHFSVSLVDSLIDWYKRLPNVGCIAPLQKLPDGSAASFRPLYIPNFWGELCYYIPFFRRKHHTYIQNTEIKDVQKVDIVPGAFVFVDYSLFANIDFFDTGTFLFFEERFIAKKMHKAGKCNYIILTEYYIHEHSKTINCEATRKKQLKYVLDGQILFTRKYRRFSFIKIFVLKSVFSIHMLEMKVRNWLNKLNG